MLLDGGHVPQKRSCKSTVRFSSLFLLQTYAVGFLDPPHATKVRYEPSRVIKGASVTLHCEVDDPGRPDNITYRWYKGSYLIKDRNSSVWTIEPVTLSDRTNFTCVAENDGGHSKPSTIYINVSGNSTRKTNSSCS